jgi:beta-1,3-galactosyltransferase 1
MLLSVMFSSLLVSQNYSGVSSVEGWDANASRNMMDYINETLPPHMMPKDFCKTKKLLLVMICSRPDGFEIRSAIRETWGRKHADASFFFLLGEVKNDYLLQHKVEVEHIRYGDTIQERFVDTYNNLSIKSVNMLKLFNKHCAKSHLFLMKVDDDVFLNVNKVVRALALRTRHTGLLLGRVRSHTKPFRSRSSKWYMPYKWYRPKTYPPFVCGPAYVMSVDVALKLYKCAMKHQLIYIEDVYLTGICARLMQIKPKNNDLFTCNRLRMNICQYKHFYTLHYYTAAEIRDSYRALQKDYCTKYKDFSVLKFWIFFTNFP